MLEKVFLQILNMSFTAGIVIIFVSMVRIPLKKAPKVFSYALWPVVLFRLLCPFSIESMFSLLPAKATPISQDIAYMQTPEIDTGIAAVNDSINRLLPAATPYASANPLQIGIWIGSRLWLFGAAAVLIYSLALLWRLQKRMRDAALDQGNIYISPKIDTPFVMGVFRPKIYLPSNLSDAQREYILLHEKIHIKRLDHIVKPISFLAVCIHWFNPLVWIAFFLSAKDMEMSCDEAVIKQLGHSVKKDYSSSLLAFAAGRRIVGGTPLAFGEGDTKGRVRNVLRYKKPAFWVGVAALAAVACVTAGFIANPIKSVPFLAADEIGSSRLIDYALSGAMASGGKTLDIPNAKISEIAGFIKQLRVEKEPVSQSRDEQRDAANRIRIVYQSPAGNSATGELDFHFSSGFKEIWLDDGTKPTFSYTVIDPAQVQAFFERQLGSTDEAAEIGSVDTLWAARTKYVGDNAAVGKLIGLLPVPKGLRYDHFALQTASQPYQVEIVYTAPSEGLAQYETADASADPFQKNALILLALIENADGIQATLTDGSRKVSFINVREWADNTVGGDVRDYGRSPEKLQELMGFTGLETAAGDAEALYSIMKLDENGGTLYETPSEIQTLAQEIIMNVIVKSAAWDGVDIRTLQESYRIRQHFPQTGEIHDYYAYQLEDGRAVLQGGTNGMYSILSSELYAQLVLLFNPAEGLSFRVKPDEAPQAIGYTAADIWLKSFLSEQIPAESRISHYEITDLSVLTADSKPGIDWEDMDYQYAARVTFDITTASEQYSSPSDGISGKGTFQSLSRVLYIKRSGGTGSYQIIIASMDGMAQEDPQP